jgi:hypothetical protein
MDIAYIGQISGIKITGVSHKKKVFRRLPSVLLLARIRYPAGSTIVNAGIFVNIASPKNMPEINTFKILQLFLLPYLLLFLAKISLLLIAKNSDKRMKGN